LRQKFRKKMTAVGFEPTPLRTGALSQRLRPLGQTALLNVRLAWLLPSQPWDLEKSSDAEI